jgi:DNA-binding GntR family transcriptional regulator
MDEVADLNVTREATTLRTLVEDKLRNAIGSGVFKPGQRLVERELCQLTGVGRTSIREALRHLEAEGLITHVAHRGPTVSTISAEEAEQLYKVRALLEGFAGREFAARRDPAAVERLRKSFARLREVAAAEDRRALIESKTALYAELMAGSGNVFVEHILTLLHNRITLLRMTSMGQAGRLKRSLREIGEIVAAIEAGDPDRAEQACVRHIEEAAKVALDVLRRSESGKNRERET